jgi:hypothetical protein
LLPHLDLYLQLKPNQQSVTAQPTYFFTGKAKTILTANTVGKLLHPRGTTIDEASKGN